MAKSLLYPALLALLAPPLSAQEVGTNSDGPLSLTLDAASQVEGACRLTFVARNQADTDIGSLVIEAVAFDADGGVARIALFDFGALPARVPRVRQFDLPDMRCDKIESVLVNGVQTCEGGAACDTPPLVSSRADVELLG